MKGGIQGGEEVVVIIPRTDRKGVVYEGASVAHHIVQVVREPIKKTKGYPGLHAPYIREAAGIKGFAKSSLLNHHSRIEIVQGKVNPNCRLLLILIRGLSDCLP